MFKSISFFLSLCFVTAPAVSAEKLSCSNLAKMTCEHIGFIQAEKNYNQYLDQIKDRFVKEFDEGLSKYKLKKFLEMTDFERPTACPGTEISTACHNALLIEMRQTADQVLKKRLGLDSKYSDPNVKRNRLAFDILDGAAADSAHAVVEGKKDEEKKIEVLFGQIKSAMIKNIGNQIGDPMKTKLIERVQSITFNGKLCTGANVPSEYYLKASAFYDPSTHVFTVCPRGILSSMNETQLGLIIGHEISHSIDPCESGHDIGNSGIHKAITDYNGGKDLELGDLQSHPYFEQLKCLRKSSSAGATNTPLDDKKIESLKNSKIDPLYYQLCERDQINEAFADWMGIEAVTEAQSSLQRSKSPSLVEMEYASVYSTKCNDVEPGFDQHPSVERRANGILAVNPKVRSDLGCQGKSEGNNYCAPPAKPKSLEETVDGESKKTGVVK